MLPMDAIQAKRNCSKRKRCFDIVFMDPPYDCDMEQPVLEALHRYPIIHKDTTIIVETSLNTDPGQFNDSYYTVERVKVYKTNQHIFLSYNSETE